MISDSFGGLRALLNPPRHHRRRTTGARLTAAGRWSLAKPKRANGASRSEDAERAEKIALTLLRRYGVVFMRMLEREAAWLPKWRDLLRVYRKLEARGDIRGGRFVSGFSGEQFALPEAVAAVRAIRRRATDDNLVSVSGADPLNLAGILTPGPKARGARRQPRALSRRHSDCLSRRQQYALPRADRAGDRERGAACAAWSCGASSSYAEAAAACSTRSSAGLGQGIPSPCQIIRRLISQKEVRKKPRQRGRGRWIRCSSRRVAILPLRLSSRTPTRACGVGLVSSDSFGGLRVLLTPSGERRRRSGHRCRQRGSGLEGAGRWSLAWSNRLKRSQAGCAALV